VYDGSTDRSRTITGRGTTVDTRYVGSEVFQQPGADTFASLIKLRDALRGANIPPGSSYNQQITQSISDLNAARTAVGEATGEQSSNLATLDALQKLIGDTQLDVTARANELESTDYSEAVVKLQEQQTALQAIYAVTARIADTNTGLLDFIR
jgi:flagellin-like hook-associated protein FlgL